MMDETDPQTLCSNTERHFLSPEQWNFDPARKIPPTGNQPVGSSFFLLESNFLKIRFFMSFVSTFIMIWYDNSFVTMLNTQK